MDKLDIAIHQLFAKYSNTQPGELMRIYATKQVIDDIKKICEKDWTKTKAI